MRHVRTLYIFLIFMLLSSTPFLHAATEQRTALVIGNSAYSSGPLKNPVNDATDMAATLKKLGFTVTLKRNAKLQEMDEAIEELGNKLKRGGVGLFYYAGHGVQVNGINYLIPIGPKINKEADVKYHAVDANRILDEMATANNGLNIVILDACRDNPFARSFRNASRGLAIVSSAPSGTFISYSTSPGNVARDGEGRNSPYTAALMKFIQEPGLTISDVFINVRTKLKKETGQVPWELSSLEGQFYFVPGKGKISIDVSESGKTVAEKDESKSSATDALDEEQRKVELEKQRLQKEEALLKEKTELEEKRRQLEEKKKQLAIVEKRPFASTGNEVRRDGRFIAYDNGTVLDTSTNLMWAAKDNGSNINWQDAKSYCENYRGGGYADWRMPTQQELAELYDSSKPHFKICNNMRYETRVATGLIDITCYAAWASKAKGSEAVIFSFSNGLWWWHNQSMSNDQRALPVRFAEVKKDSRFIDNGNGTVTDTKTGLMWAAKDNGSDINWYNTKSYCENYRAGGYTDWRMPTQDELAGLYDYSINGKNGYHLTNLIELTAWWPWASETRGSEAAYFYFGAGGGYRVWSPQSDAAGFRVLPVRSGK
ncbi:MAG: caspase family protein [Syntrophales bacterium]|jgi:uncharacterized caspase-like protein